MWALFVGELIRWVLDRLFGTRSLITPLDTGSKRYNPVYIYLCYNFKTRLGAFGFKGSGDERCPVYSGGVLIGRVNVTSSRSSFNWLCLILSQNGR